MNCEEVQARADAYLDAELEPDMQLETERHIRHCPACGPVYAERHALHALLKKQAPDFRASARLHAAIEARLPRTETGSKFFPTWQGWRRTVALFGATAVLAVIVTWNIASYQRAADWEDALKDDAVAVHMRSLQEGHLVDVRAADPRQLDAWFKARLPFAATVRDLSPYGYMLVGGRLDYLYAGPLAATVYRRAGHLVNLLAWPATSSDRFPASALTEDGLHIRFFLRDGMNFCVISDMGGADFEALVRILTRA